VPGRRKRGDARIVREPTVTIGNMRTICIPLALIASSCATMTPAARHAEDVREYGAHFFARSPADLTIAASRSLADLGYTVDSVDAERHVVVGHRVAVSETLVDAIDHGPHIARTVDVEVEPRGDHASFVVVIPRAFADGRDVTEDPSARAGEIREMQSILALTAVELPPDFDALCFLFPPLDWWRWFYDEKPVVAHSERESIAPIPHVIASTPVAHAPPAIRGERPHPRQPH
jgi:hypothetical protein